MGKEFAEIDERIRDWIGHQKMFFVATAPLHGNGHVKYPPKGLDSLQGLRLER